MPQTLGARYLLAQGSGTIYEPVRQHSWEVTVALSRLTRTEEVTLAAQKVTPPKYTHEVKDIWHMNERTRYAGRGKAEEIKITFMDVFNPEVIRDLYNHWSILYRVAAGTVASGGLANAPVMGFASQYKTTIRIMQYDIQGGPLRTWMCYGCFPSHSPASAMLDYGGDSALDFEQNFSVDRFELI